MTTNIYLVIILTRTAEVNQKIFAHSALDATGNVATANSQMKKYLLGLRLCGHGDLITAAENFGG